MNGESKKTPDQGDLRERTKPYALCFICATGLKN